jgi:hypothetical protein
VLVAMAGCKPVQPPPPQEIYHPIPVPAGTPKFLEPTLYALVEASNTGGFPLSSYGLVTGLRGTGDTTAPATVREWMRKEMARHGIGSASMGSQMSPDQMLADSRVAIVAVMANIPPGARKDDRIDVVVQALPNNNTTSLSNGMLWRSTLRINGMSDPYGAVNEFARVQGNIFVNPAYAAAGPQAPTTQTSMRASLRTGLIPGGGVIITDRPIHLLMRNPSWSGSRSVESRINNYFQTTDPFREPAASAQDQGYLHLLVPHSFHGNWEHCIGVVTHLYMNADHGYLALKAKELAEEAMKPDAFLMDISFCWEGMGEVAIPAITPLLSCPQQDVQFAAARAAAFIGDRYGEDTLVQIARTPSHAFQLQAVQALGDLPNSPLINASLATLLDSDESLVRIEAYRVLSAHNDGHIFSKVIHSKLNPDNEFVLDMIASSGPPLIYCTRVGQPRVAVFGRKVSMQTPVVFDAFDTRLTIATMPDRPRTLNIYYREEGRRNPTQALSGPDVAELIARLGGASDEGFHFTYGDVVAILQSMVDKKAVAAAFVLQPLPGVDEAVKEAPHLPDQGRPTGGEANAGSTTQGGASLPDLPLPPPPKKDGDK